MILMKQNKRQRKSQSNGVGVLLERVVKDDSLRCSHLRGDMSKVHSENEDHGIWSHHFMGNRWGNSENSVRLSFLGSKTTANGDCSHEIKRRLLLGRKVMTNLDSLLKSRDITLPTKFHLVKVTVFPVVIYGCESWTFTYKES